MVAKINADTSNGVVITSDTSGEIELQANGITKAKITANGLQDANGASLRGGMYRNLIINGDMRIAQRGTSQTGITTGGYYTCDRWYATVNGAGTWTQTQDTDVPTGQGFANSLKLACTTANASLGVSEQLNINQKIEANNLQHLKYGTSNAESLTMSFWVKSNKTGTYTFWIYQEDDARSISKTYTIDSADTWEKKTITIEGDTVGVIDNNNGAGFWVGFYLAAGSNFTSGTFSTIWGGNVSPDRVSSSQVNLADSTSNYINITGVQLEVGSGASDFEHLPYDVQLRRCQRYCQSWYSAGAADHFASGYSGGGNGGKYSYHNVENSVIMRAAPTSFTSSAFSSFFVNNTEIYNSAAVDILINQSNPRNVLFRFETSGQSWGTNTPLRVRDANTSAAYIIWEAEL